jgi:hypothetical protein
MRGNGNKEKVSIGDEYQSQNECDTRDHPTPPKRRGETSGWRPPLHYCRLSLAT